MPTREEAIQILETDFKRARELLSQVPPDAVLTTGIGGAGWSPRDLVGHLFYWERAALEALDAWANGGAAPIDRILYRGINAVNADALRAIRAQEYDELLKQADWAHNGLVGYIEGIGDDLWENPPTARHMHSMGDSLGRILLGSHGLFTHYQEHIPDLEAFVERGAKA